MNLVNFDQLLDEEEKKLTNSMDEVYRNTDAVATNQARNPTRKK